MASLPVWEFREYEKASVIVEIRNGGAAIWLGRLPSGEFWKQKEVGDLRMGRIISAAEALAFCQQRDVSPDILPMVGSAAYEIQRLRCENLGLRSRIAVLEAKPASGQIESDASFRTRVMSEFAKFGAEGDLAEARVARCHYLDYLAAKVFMTRRVGQLEIIPATSNSDQRADPRSDALARAMDAPSITDAYGR